MVTKPAVFWLIAGPNGVGKTTYAFRTLKAVTGSVNFINMDEIARGLSPLEPKAAERDAACIALDRAHSFIATGTTFAMETTLSGHAHLRLADEAKNAGLGFHLMYFSVPDPSTCLARIARRVAEGGHDVDADVVRRRFFRSLENLPAYCRKADLWRVYANSGARPCLAVEGNNSVIAVSDAEGLVRAHPAIDAMVEAFR